MLSLSIDRINRSSPYKVVHNGDGSVVFVTDHGIKYDVSFVADYTLQIDNSYQLCIDIIEGQTQPRDVKVRDTIIAIVEEFFQNNELSILYICDSSDGRQKSRHRIFIMWFAQTIQNEKYTLIPAHVTVDDIDYYASLILSKRHPEYLKITQAFMDFQEDISSKWN